MERPLIISAVNLIRCGSNSATFCYVSIQKQRVHRSVIWPLYAGPTVCLTDAITVPIEGLNMDEYQEELLEYQAIELDPPEPADDATEL